MALLPDEELVKIADLHPPNCDCCHEMCGEMARELLDARKQIAALKEGYHDGWNQFQAERERAERAELRRISDRGRVRTLLNAGGYGLKRLVQGKRG